MPIGDRLVVEPEISLILMSGCVGTPFADSASTLLLLDEVAIVEVSSQWLLMLEGDRIEPSSGTNVVARYLSSPVCIDRDSECSDSREDCSSGGNR